jgi:polyhydroxyalkanoate synthesis repressor PhaR
MAQQPKNTLRIIKKYPNRRLYDTEISSYITLEDVRKLIVDGESFEVRDAKTGEDLTRQVLLQIIQEAESDGEPIFSTDMLKGIIRFYGPFQGMLGNYLEKSIQAVLDIQAKTGQQSSQAWSDFMRSQLPVMQDLMGQYVEQSKQLYLNTQNLFGMFPGFPGAAGRGEKDKKDDDKA